MKPTRPLFFASFSRALCARAFVVVFAVAFAQSALPLETAANAQAVSSSQLSQLRERSRQALFLDSPLPPLATKSYSTLLATPNICVEHVTFATQYGQRIPAVIYVPAQPHSKVPAIIVVCGHGGDKSSWYAVYTGLLYASAGAVVVTYDPVGEFERSVTRGSETGEHDKLIPGLTLTERLGGWMIEDAMQTIRYTASRSDVDAARIAVAGYSMGSFHALLATALAGPPLPKVRALVLSGGGNLDGPNEYWDSNPKPNCQSGPYMALNFLGDRGATLWAMRARVGPSLVLNGTEDSLITKFDEQEPFFIGLRDRIATIEGTHTNLPETLWFQNVGHRPSWVTRPAALWLNRQLHFPNWTDAQINAFPTIRAADWAAKAGVRISHGYEVEQKEGGVPALDLRLPGLTREQLTAVPQADWERDHALYTLEGWTPHALAEDRAAPSTAASPVQSKYP